MIFPSHYDDVYHALADSSFKSYVEQNAITVAELILRAHSNSKITTIFGNGGSAADSQHLAAELMCTYEDRQRPSVSTIALTTDTSVITAWSNDFSYESVFSRQLEGLSQINGLSIGLSTSGSSRNVLKALDIAKMYGAETVLISGNGCSFKPYSRHIMLPSTNTAAIQTLTQVFYHSICEIIDRLLTHSLDE